MTEQRLIDAFAFRRELDNYSPFTKYEQRKHGIEDLAKSTVLYVLEKMPTIEERKTGKWISLDDFRGRYNDYGYKCSECGEHSDYEENFCPNCGTDMRGNDNGSNDTDT